MPERQKKNRGAPQSTSAPPTGKRVRSPGRRDERTVTTSTKLSTPAYSPTQAPRAQSASAAISRFDRIHVKGATPAVDGREEAQRDRDRVLYSSEFRRLAGVTQVVRADEGQLFHNRLTHSLKVAQIGRRIAEKMLRASAAGDAGWAPEIIEAAGGLNADVVETACLCHDIGHPPFGHIAEDKLQELGLSHGAEFEGNAQSFRIVTRLAVRREPDQGLDLTRASLNAILKYPMPRGSTTSSLTKFGYYPTEADEWKHARALLPAGDSAKSLEAEIMDWSDDVTYAVHDLDDFYRAGFIPLGALLQKTSERAQYFEWYCDFDDAAKTKKGGSRMSPTERTALVKRLGLSFDRMRSYAPELVLSPTYTGEASQRGKLSQFASQQITRFLDLENLSVQKTAPRLIIDDDVRLEVNALKALMNRYVYQNPALVAQQEGQREVIKVLFEKFFEASDPGKKQLLPLIPPSLRYYVVVATTAAKRARLAMDAIVSLTEAQAVLLSQRLTGHVPGSIMDSYVW
jgi:dGTPase